MSSSRHRTTIDAGGRAITAQREIQVLPLGIVVATGIGAVAFTWATGTPGDGWFLAGAVVAGFVTALVAPGWAGYAVLMGTITVVVGLADTADGYAGLTWLIVGAMVVPATLGTLAGYATVRARRLGVRTAIRDPRTLAAGGGVVAIAASILSLAASFATNPP